MLDSQVLIEKLTELLNGYCEIHKYNDNTYTISETICGYNNGGHTLLEISIDQHDIMVRSPFNSNNLTRYQYANPDFDLDHTASRIAIAVLFAKQENDERKFRNFFNDFRNFLQEKCNA
jgi:hypothetical protein